MYSSIVNPRYKTDGSGHLIVSIKENSAPAVRSEEQNLNTSSSQLDWSNPIEGSVSTTPITLAEANSERNGLILCNLSDSVKIYLNFQSTVSLNRAIYILQPQQTLFLPAEEAQNLISILANSGMANFAYRVSPTSIAPVIQPEPEPQPEPELSSGDDNGSFRRG